MSTVAENTTLSREEVESKIAQLQQQYDEAKNRVQQSVERTKDQAVEAVDEAGEGLAGASFGAFLALLLGGAAAVLGAILGTPEGAMVVAPETTTTGRRERTRHE